MRNFTTLLIALVLFSQTVAASIDPREFRRIITDYYYAIGESRIEEALSLYHHDSPQTPEVRRGLEYGQSVYLQRTSTLSLNLIHLGGVRATVRASHRHLRIAGIKFMEEFTETHYVFRRHGDVWKIWSSIDHRPRQQQ